jgi:ADP-ribosylglycohydrolase
VESLARYRGCLLGLAAGDALGAAVEFSAPGSFAPLGGMTGGGPFNLRAGQWTDDTSMALCLAESLAERGGFDPLDQMERYLRWYRQGYWSSTGACFDIGGTTRWALERFERERQPYCGATEIFSAGNGSLMRLAPLSMAYARHPALAVGLAGASSLTTHALPITVDACRYFGGLIAGALQGASKDDLLQEGYAPAAGLWAQRPLHEEIAAVAGGSFKRRQPPQIQGSGYAPLSLEAALWAFYRSDSFEAGALLAANLGDDADTTAAVFGQLAGAYYGEAGIPAGWRALLARGGEIVALAETLYALSRAMPGDRSEELALAGISE